MVRGIQTSLVGAIFEDRVLPLAFSLFKCGGPYKPQIVFRQS